MATRLRRSWTRISAVAAASCLALPFVASAGHASTLGNIQAEIAAAQSQLHELQLKSDAASNAYDLGQERLQQADSAVATAQARVAKATASQQGLMNEMSAVVSAAFQGSDVGALSALTEGGPQSFLDRATSLQALSASDETALAQYTAATEVVREASISARQALAAQRAQTATLLAQRTAILSAARQEQALLGRLEAEEQQLAAQARAAAAAAAARAAAQRLAAEQAAAAAAAASFSAQPVDPTPAPPLPAGSGGAAVAVHWAYLELGKPYVWGAAGPDSFDCSGLTQYVWGKAGVYLGHYTGDQWNAGPHVSLSQLIPGDLVFFVGSDGSYAQPGHVGIYIGGGDMIDAPYTGTVVQIQPIDQPDYVGAVQIG